MPQHIPRITCHYRHTHAHARAHTHTVSTSQNTRCCSRHTLQTSPCLPPQWSVIPLNTYWSFLFFLPPSLLSLPPSLLPSLLFRLSFLPYFSFPLSPSILLSLPPSLNCLPGSRHSMGEGAAISTEVVNSSIHRPKSMYIQLTSDPEGPRQRDQYYSMGQKMSSMPLLLQYDQ